VQSLEPIGIRRLRVHPISIIGDQVLGWLNLWVSCRGGPMTPGKLPYGGGVADQPAQLMAVFALMEQTAAQLQPKPET
jgi:hypothetical protein